MTSMFSWYARYPASASPEILATSPAFYLVRAIEQVVVFSIPAFIFVSGYFAAFLAGRQANNISYKQTISRIKGLLIPYLLWSVLFMSMGVVEGKSFGPDRIATNILLGTTTPAYYYVPLIIQLYLIAPVLIALARRNWKALILLTALLQILVHLPASLSLWGIQNEWINAIPQIPKWLFVSRLFWFSAGIVAGLHLARIRPVLQKMNPLFGYSVIFFLVAGFIEWEVFKGPIQTRETIIDWFYEISVLLFFLSLLESKKLPLIKAFNFLGSKSYGVYLVHVPIMEIIARGIYLIAPWVLPNQLLFFVLIFIPGLGIPLLGMQLFSSPKFKPIYGYLFG